MTRVLVTGASTGLGLMAAQLLFEQGHEAVLHARSEARAAETRKELGRGAEVVLGDLSNLAGMRAVAAQANKLGRFDAVIHNAGLGNRDPRSETADGLMSVFAVNTLAPYVLTALMQKPGRLVFLSSGMHRNVTPRFDDLNWTQRAWASRTAYSESKLYDMMLAFAIARRWPGVLSNAVEPGWVQTRMGGPEATDDLDQGHRTQVWLAVSDDPAARVSGRGFYHLHARPPNPASLDIAAQDRLLEVCAELSGVALPP